MLYNLGVADDRQVHDSEPWTFSGYGNGNGQPSSALGGFDRVARDKTLSPWHLHVVEEYERVTQRDFVEIS